MVWKKKGARPVWHLVMVDSVEEGAVSASLQENHCVCLLNKLCLLFFSTRASKGVLTEEAGTVPAEVVLAFFELIPQHYTCAVTMDPSIFSGSHRWSVPVSHIRLRLPAFVMLSSSVQVMDVLAVSEMLPPAAEAFHFAS